MIEAMSMPESGIPTTTPAYEPQNARVAKRERSRGGAQYLQIPWHAGYVTPCIHNFINSVKTYFNYSAYVIFISVSTWPPMGHSSLGNTIAISW